MSYANYDDVIQQLQDYGLELNGLEIGKIVRCNMEDDRKRSKTGWYTLHELIAGNGDRLLVGAYGDWRDTVTHKIKLNGRKLSPEEREAIKARMASDRKEAAAKRKAAARRAASRAEKVWKMCRDSGESPYLTKKQCVGYGIKYTDSNALVIPIMDVSGNIHGLQFIHSDPEVIKKRGRDRDYWPYGLDKVGRFHHIGFTLDMDIIMVVEGYATGDTVHQATGKPVAVAFDKGNLLPVCQRLKKHYPRAKLLICADDDFATYGNPGVTCASSTAMAVGGAHIIPKFKDDPLRASVKQAKKEHDPGSREEHKELITPLITGRQKKTDFNDLHISEGLPAVKEQFKTRREELGWNSRVPSALAPQTGGEGENRLLPISSPSEVMERFALVYGHNGTVFDFWEHQLVKLSDMRDACTAKYVHQQWSESPNRMIVRIKNVGFDPAGKDPNITCNLYSKWPTKPKKGKCDRLLEHLEYLCSGEENSRELYKWMLRWLAYPIQNPGAKMKSCVVVHGPQGVGKNIFFESVMAIYGEYGRIIDQAAVEDNFNDCFSKKLFLIADEVVARQELYHIKNKLKVIVTGTTIRINSKMVQAYDEVNHVNLVFLSNETLPVVLERDDRRHCIIWTPPKLDKFVYKDIKEEIDEGGIEALHDYLLNLDLGDFNEYTEPPLTRAKTELIELSMDSSERFWRLWVQGEIEHVPVVPCLSTDFYQLYKEYCKRIGYSRYAPEPKLLAEIGKRSDAEKRQIRYGPPGDIKRGVFIMPPKAEPPSDKPQSLWLMKCVEEFREGYKLWRDAGNILPQEVYP